MNSTTGVERWSRDMPFGDMNSTTGVERWSRDIPPAHFIFMIRSFSLLSETGNEVHESGVFQACDKKWKLCVYPEGNKEANGDDHISLYLQIVDIDNFPLGWEVHVKFSLFVYDHVQDKYLTIQDAGGKVRRFHYMRTQWGFDQLLPLSTFYNPSNGYLVNDTCAFGAEVLVVSHATKRECLSMVKEPRNGTYTWKVNNFTSIRNIFIYSDQFTIEGSKWKLLLYPKGNLSVRGQSLSLYLKLDDLANLTPYNRKLYAKYKLRICNQLNSKHNEKQAQRFFGGSPAVTCSNFANLIHLNQLENATKGFLVDDSIIVEVEFMLLSKFSEF